MTMKKGCAYNEQHADAPSGELLALNSSAHKIGIRRAYYAMINEVSPYLIIAVTCTCASNHRCLSCF
jgi:hypothetical protein